MHILIEGLTEERTLSDAYTRKSGQVRKQRLGGDARVASADCELHRIDNRYENSDYEGQSSFIGLTDVRHIIDMLSQYSATCPTFTEKDLHKENNFESRRA